MPAWLIALLPVIGPPLFKAALAAAALGVAWVNAHHWVKNQKLADAIQHVEDAVGPVVRSVAQAYVDDILASASDGVLTDAEKSQALNKALDALKDSIPVQYRSILALAFPGTGLDTWLTTLINGAVKDLKLESKKAGAFENIPGFSRSN